MYLPASVVFLRTALTPSNTVVFQLVDDFALDIYMSQMSLTALIFFANLRQIGARNSNRRIVLLLDYLSIFLDSDL